MQKSFKFTPLLAAMALAVAGVAPAMADPVIVTKWDYTTSATFLTQYTTWESTGSGSQTNSASELSWGGTTNFWSPSGNSATDRSALTIGSGTGIVNGIDERRNGAAVSGSIETRVANPPNVPINPGDLTSDQKGNGVTFSHWNNPINADFKTLAGGTVLDKLTLTPTLPNDGSPVNAPDIDFEFRFLETPNDPANNAPCAGNTPEPCGDLYGIVGFGNFNQYFDYSLSGAEEDKVRYYASIFVLGPTGGPSPIGTLLPAECAALGLTEDCQGFRTNELAVTTVRFAFSITTAPLDVPNDVPEPASLALVGLALAGLGISARRRRQA